MAIPRLHLELIDGTPDGLRRLSEMNWVGECLVCPRAALQLRDHWDELDKPGVYVLVGDGEKQPKIYIGQGDSIGDRLDSHIKSEKKRFWHTAVAFKRTTADLHPGLTRYLEARLMERAKEANRCEITNGVFPAAPALPFEAADMEVFLDKLVEYMAVLNVDFFRSTAQTGDPIDAIPDAPEVPPQLNFVFNELRSRLSAVATDVAFYNTRCDYRAKVVGPTDFRVFARIKPQRKALLLKLKDVADYRLTAPEDINEQVQTALLNAYERAKPLVNPSA